MDRPRTGRRRVRSGAVRATEIIDRATRRFPRHPNAPAEDAPTAEMATLPADEPLEHRRPTAHGRSSAPAATRPTSAAPNSTAPNSTARSHAAHSHAAPDSAVPNATGSNSAASNSTAHSHTAHSTASSPTAHAHAAPNSTASDSTASDSTAHAHAAHSHAAHSHAAHGSEGRRPAGSRAAKLAGLALAALTLCGTVGAAVAVSRERGATASAGQVGPITGHRALLPDDLAAAVSGTATAAPAPPPPRTAASTAIVGGGRAPDNGDGTQPAAEHPEPPPSTAGMSDEDLVAEYYRLVRHDPVHAFGLLSGTAFGSDLGHFISAWSGVTDVQVGDIVATPDGVQADVRMLLASGQTLWVRQLFDVTETTPRRIANVTLLSAQVS